MRQTREPWVHSSCAGADAVYQHLRYIAYSTLIDLNCNQISKPSGLHFLDLNSPCI